MTDSNYTFYSFNKLLLKVLTTIYFTNSWENSHR
jgi:hypothetical protein